MTTATDPAATESTTTTDQPPAPAAEKPDAATESELERWKGLARKNEDRAKANAAAAARVKDLESEIEQLRTAQMSEQEKAIADAKTSARTEALAEVAQRLAGAEIRVALTGVVPDPGALVEDLNLARYITESGDVDVDAVAALREKFAGLTSAAGQSTAPKVPAGTRGTPGTITRDQLKSMSPEQIDAARRNGQLDHLMRGD